MSLSQSTQAGDYAAPGRGVGGDFGLAPDDLRRPATSDPRCVFGLEPQHWALFGSGRAGLKWILEETGAEPGDEVLLPSYLCPALLRPVLTLGLKPAFYRVDHALNVDVWDVERRLSRKTKLLLFIHYFGFPQPADVVAGLANLRGRVVLVEDCVQALLTRSEGRWLGQTGDYSFVSFRKFVAVPDGAWVRARRALAPAPQGEGAGKGAMLRLAGMLLKHGYLQSGEQDDRVFQMYMELLRTGEASFDDLTGPEGGSELTWHLLGLQDWEGIMRTRRDNYRWLADAIAGMPGLALLRSSLPDSVCPLGLPIVLPDEAQREKLRATLVREGVYTPVHWRLPDEVDEGQFHEAWDLSRRELTIPIDQRYGRQEMVYVAGAIGRALGEG